MAKMTQRLQRKLRLWRNRLAAVMNEDHILAHKHSSYHRAELEKSAVCGCFYCLASFPPSDIVEWIDGHQTAICPKCPVDSVIGSASEYPITKEFLQRMHDHWF